MASRTMWEGREEVGLRAGPWSRPIHTNPCRSVQAPLGTEGTCRLPCPWPVCGGATWAEGLGESGRAVPSPRLEQA